MSWLLRKVILKIACLFIRNKDVKNKFYDKYNPGPKVILLPDVDHYVPESVLKHMENTEFMAGGGAILAS